MTTNETRVRPPVWAEGATRASSFARGMAVMFTLPAMMVYATHCGYGVFARDAGMSLGQSLLATAMLWQMPGIILLVDQAGRGAGFATILVGVALTSVRLLPISIVLLPYIRPERRSLLRDLAASHFIAATVWLESLRRLPVLPRDLRLAHFLGIGAGLVAGSLIVSTVSYTLAAGIPASVSAAFLFMTPLYFFISMSATATARADRLALATGLVMGPLVYLIMPGLDLVATGLAGGTIAWLIGRRRRAA